MTCAPLTTTTSPRALASRRARAGASPRALRWPLVGLCALLLGALPVPPASAKPPQPSPKAAPTPLIHVDFKRLPLQELVFLFSSLTGQNFILLAPDLASLSITVYAPKPVTLAQATDLFITALRLHGLRVERRDPFWLIQRAPP